MEILKFEKGDMTDIDFANKKIEFIVNRANEFNKEKYPYIVIDELTESDKDFLFYQCVRILALFKQVPIYINKQIYNLSYFDKTNTTFKVLSNRKLKKKLKSNEALIFSRAAEDEDETEGVRIFKGFLLSDLNNIVEEVYKNAG